MSPMSPRGNLTPRMSYDHSYVSLTNRARATPRRSPLLSPVIQASNVVPYKTATHLSIRYLSCSLARALRRYYSRDRGYCTAGILSRALARHSRSLGCSSSVCFRVGGSYRPARPGDGEQAAGAVVDVVPRDPARRQGRLATGCQGGVPEPGAAVAPGQTPAGNQVPRRGQVQGHHRGIRGAAGPAGEQGGARRARRRQEQARREGPRRRRRQRCSGETGSTEREGGGGGGCRAPHAAEAGGGQERVQRRQQQRRAGRRPARARRVLELRGAQGAAAGAQAGVHPRGALRRVQEGGPVHPRRRHQERVDRQGGGEEDHPREAGVEERHEGDAGLHGRRAAGVPGRRRRVRGVGEAAQAVQAARRRPGAPGAGAAGERAHGLVALVPAARRREDALLLPRRGHLPRVRQGRQGRRHARRRRRGRRARGPQGQARRRLPREPHRPAAEGARRDSQRLRLMTKLRLIVRRCCVRSA